MSTKYKYGENGSYFDPETKRTYYKDPQYQKAYDDEWNRLEKLYKMKQEEQRRIEMANFQRVLAQADALTKSMQALGYRVPLPWEQKNRFDDGGEALTQRRYYQDGDYTGYTRDNGHPIAFDDEGNLTDQVTGEKGTMRTGTPDVVAIGEKKRIGIPMTSPSAPIPLPGILSPSVEEYVKAADNTASALSAANWMDTAYDAMYTPDEINYPWDEGNKGLGSPVLDFGFDFATGLGLSKLKNLSKLVNGSINDFTYMLPDNSTVKQYATLTRPDGSFVYPKTNAAYQRYLARRTAHEGIINAQKTSVVNNQWTSYLKKKYIDSNPFETPVLSMLPERRAEFLRRGYYDPTHREIRLGGGFKNYAQLDDTLAHELGHADQYQWGEQTWNFVFREAALEYLKEIGLDPKVVREARYLYTKDPDNSKYLGHALGFYLDKGFANTLEPAANMTVAKGATGWSKTNIPTVEEFENYVYGQGWKDWITPDIKQILDYPNLVIDKEAFMKHLIEKALAITPAAAIAPLAVDNNESPNK